MKCHVLCDSEDTAESLRSSERGLKYVKLMLLFLRLMSLRSSERGLKYYVKYLTPVVEKSLRSSERGLKCTIFGSNFGKCIVAPFVGAWIEISCVRFVYH